MPLHVSTVVVPIDFSVASTGAIETALEIVDSPSQIHLIHVMLPLETMSPGVLLGDVTDVSRTEKVTTALKKLADDHDADGVHLAVMIGTPAEIVDHAGDIRLISFLSHRTDTTAWATLLRQCRRVHVTPRVGSVSDEQIMNKSMAANHSNVISSSIASSSSNGSNSVSGP